MSETTTQASTPTAPEAAPEVANGSSTAVATAPKDGSQPTVNLGPAFQVYVDAQNARVQTFTNEVTEGNITVGADDNLASVLQQRVAELDLLLAASVGDILHTPAFQKLEASWRGLNQLVFNTDTGTMLKLRVLSATAAELHDDLARAVDFDQSALFKKLYEEEYGTFGGNPYSVLVFDHEFDATTPELELAQGLAGVAAAAHAPMIAAASPVLFDPGWTDFQGLPNPRDLSKIFESTDLVPWKSFRESEDSRYLTLVLPRVLMRLPYGAKTVPVEGMSFEECVDDLPAGTGYDPTVARPKAHAKYLWGTATWALAQRITEAYSLYGWCAAIRGVEGGGVVEGLPFQSYDTPAGDKAVKIPTEVTITDRREKELNDLGFIALCYCKGTDYACFFGGATVQKPVVYTNPDASENAQASALLPYVLAASRFAHYIKQIGREKVGSFQTRTALEKYLNNWIADYVLLNDDAPQSAKARYPLREARIDVTEVPGQLGAYNATVFLRPHFQLEELTASIRLVAKLPPPQAAA